jgi:hypothetical protein
VWAKSGGSQFRNVVFNLGHFSLLFASLFKCPAIIIFIKHVPNLLRHLVGQTSHSWYLSTMKHGSGDNLGMEKKTIHGCVINQVHQCVVKMNIASAQNPT